jgi:hypothetical protein
VRMAFAKQNGSTWWYWQLLFIVFCAGCSAKSGGSDAPSAGRDSMDAARHSTDDIYRALVSPDGYRTATSLMEQMRCDGETTGVRDVERAWRDSGTVGVGFAPAIANPYVRTLAAKCLIEASQYSVSETIRESAALYLRGALQDASLAGLAIPSIMPAATPADISTIVGIASSEPNVAVIAVTSLSERCEPVARDGIAKLRAQYVGTPVGSQIDAFIAGQAYRDQVARCDQRPGLAINPRPGLPQPADTATAEKMIDANQLKLVLRGSSVADAREALRNHVSCEVGDVALSKVLRDAWLSRDDVAASASLHDVEVQAEISMCLIEASAPQPERAEALAFLRSHIDSDDVMIVLASAVGLASNGDPQDIESIARISKRLPAVTNFLAARFAMTCGVTIARILNRMEAQIEDPNRKQMLAATYLHSEEWRKKNCRQ